MLRINADNKRPRGLSVDGVASVNKPLGKTWIQHAVFTVKNDMGHILRFIFASRSVMMLMLAYAIIFPVRLNQVFNLLQYMTKRFNWEWSTVRLFCSS
jgi:hypothetical protein